MAANDKPAVAQALLDVIPTGNFLEPGWNLVYINNFGIATGGRNFLPLGGPVVAQFRPDGMTAIPDAILAHELGHSLGLQHPSDPDPNNLMTQSADGGPGTELTAQQIIDARAQAATGDAKRTP